MSEDQTTGLTTTTLHDGVVNKGAPVITPKEDTTVFELASDIDVQTKKLLELLDKNDDEMNARLNNIVKSIGRIKEETTGETV